MEELIEQSGNDCNSIVWRPQNPQKTQMWSFMRHISQMEKIELLDYPSLYQWSLKNLDKFWLHLTHFFHVQFDTAPDATLIEGMHMIDTKWFPGSTLNFAEHLLKKGEDHSIALISINEQNERDTFTYQRLKNEVANFQRGLIQEGIGPGDRVIAVMPNIPQTIIGMLASASIGAIWASCSPDFGVQAIIDRLGQIEPKILLIGDGYTYQGKVYDHRDKILQLTEQLPTLKKVVIFPYLGLEENLRGTPYIYWKNFCTASNKPLKFTPLPFNHPLSILFSSGTTGKPKCIIHSAGGTLLQHLKELGLHTDLSPKDKLCFYTTCGWMMWNWMVSSLALGTALVLYEGSATYPDTTRLLKIIEEEQITVFGTSAKFISTLEKTDDLKKQKIPLPSLRCILSTGSPLLPQHYDFVYKQLKSNVQLSSISGGTDIVSCFALGNPILPIYRGELQCIGLGMSVDILNEKGQSLVNEFGELVCTKPFPSMPIGFWDDPNQEKYKKAYFQHFPGIWAHGDFAKITLHNGLIIHGRSDAVLNPGGVRIGTAEIYRQVEKIPEVLESIVVGQDWKDDSRIVLFVRLKEPYLLTDELIQTIRQTIRENASPRHVPAKILQVPEIPRTMSGKIVELAVRDIVNGHSIQNLESIANPQSLDFFKNRQELTF